jgi:hypothetical protein
MSRMCIRALWGIYEHDGRRFYKRRSRQDHCIKMVKINPTSLPFCCYTFGEDNHKFLIDNGVDSRLVDKRAIIWDMETEQFRHKLEVLKCGLSDYDEIIFMDWDCLAIRPFTDDMWDKVGKGEDIKAILRMYKRRKATWRKGDMRKIPEASWVYLRGKQVGDDLIDTWEKMNRPWSEEIVLAKYTDERLGGWQGVEAYWDNFEPPVFTWANTRVCSPELFKQKPTFAHYAPNIVEKLMRGSNEDNINKKLKRFCERRNYYNGESR